MNRWLYRALVRANELRRRTRGPLREAWSNELEAWTRLMHHYARRSHYLPLRWQRRALTALVPRQDPRGVEREPFAIGPVAAEWLVPPEADPSRVLLYLHGGGYALGSIESHRHFVAHLARRAGVRGLIIDYRLAPEHPFPAGLDDAKRAWGWLLDQGIDPKHAAIAGESAGGGLTLATLLSLRDEGVPLPAAAAVLSPWVDLTLSGETIRTNDRFDFVPRPVLEHYVRAYAAEHDPSHPLISPAHGELERLPPLLIQAGEAETLLDDSRLLHRRATEAGVNATLTVYPDMVHAFMLMRAIPTAGEATEEIARHLREHLFD